MDSFYEILDLIYKANKKYSELRFGQLIDVLKITDEDWFSLSNEEIKTRLEKLLNEE